MSQILLKENQLCPLTWLRSDFVFSPVKMEMTQNNSKLWLESNTSGDVTSLGESEVESWTHRHYICLGFTYPPLNWHNLRVRSEDMVYLPSLATFKHYPMRSSWTYFWFCDCCLFVVEGFLWGGGGVCAPVESTHLASIRVMPKVPDSWEISLQGSCRKDPPLPAVLRASKWSDTIRDPLPSKNLLDQGHMPGKFPSHLLQPYCILIVVLKLLIKWSYSFTLFSMRSQIPLLAIKTTTYYSRAQYFKSKNNKPRPGAVTHTCIPSTFRGKGRRIALTREFKTNQGNMTRLPLYKKFKKLTGCGGPLYS